MSRPQRKQFNYGNVEQSVMLHGHGRPEKSTRLVLSKSIMNNPKPPVDALSDSGRLANRLYKSRQEVIRVRKAR